MCKKGFGKTGKSAFCSHQAQTNLQKSHTWHVIRPGSEGEKDPFARPFGPNCLSMARGLKKGKRLRAPLANAKIVNFRPRCKCVVKRQDKAQGHADLCGRPTWCSILPVLMT